jgi:hypothetical protein
MVETVPKFNLHHVAGVRNKLHRRVFADRIQETVSSEMLLTATRDVMKCVPGATRDAVYETLRVYAGEPLTEKLGVSLCWLIAGNMDKLKNGIPLRMWSGQTIDEWMPMRVVSVQLARPYKEVVHACTFKILAGSASEMVILRYLSRAAVKYIACKIGFSQLKGSYPYHHPQEIIGLRLIGKFEPHLVRDAMPSFREIYCPASMLQRNRSEYLCVRSRKLLQCPSGFNHACARCAYGTDRCKYAVHPVTFEVGACPRCMNADALFDPAVPGTLCTACVVQAAITKKRV